MAKPYPERGQNYGPSDSGEFGSGTQPYTGLDRIWFAGFDAGVHPLLDVLPSAIYVTDEKGHLTYFNPACIAFSGRTPELGTDSWCVTWKLFHPDGTPMPHETCPMAMALKEGRSIRGTEAIAERPDGSRIWFEPYPTPLFDREGNLIGGINMLVDITERKRTETELRRAHDQQQAELADSTLLQNVSAAMIEQENVEAIYEQILEAAADIMRSDFASMQMFYPERGDVGELLLLASRGFAPETASFWKWVRPDSNSSCGEAFRTGSRCVVPNIENCEFMAGTDDRVVYLKAGILAVQSTPLISRSGKLLGMISTHWKQPHQPSERNLRLLDILARQAADLLERRKAEQALLESEQRFRVFTEATSDIVYRMSADWTEMRQLQGREFLADTIEPSKTWLERYVPADDHRSVSETIQEALATRSTYELEHRVLRMDGSIGWVHSRAIPILNAEGEIIEWFGAASDVTRRKEAEESLEKQRHLYEAVLSTTPDLAYIFDRDHRFIYANEGLLKLWGKSWDEAIGKNCLELGYEPWHAEMHNREIDRVVATKQPIRGVVPFTGTLGRRLYDYIFTPVLDANGQVQAVAGTTRDITEIKETEERLRSSEERLGDELAGMTRLHELSMRLSKRSSLAEVMHDVMEAAGEFLGTDHCTAQLIDRETGSLNLVAHMGFDVDFADRFRIIDSEDCSTCAAAMARLNRVIVEDLSSSAEFAEFASHVIPLGLSAAMSTPLLGDDGSLLGVFTTYWTQPHAPDEHRLRLLDLYVQQAARQVERRAAEQALRESEERFRAMAENIPQLAWMARPDGHIYWYNRRWYEFTGTSPESQEGWGWQSVHHPDYLESVMAKWTGAIKAGQPWEDTFPLRGTDGQYRWFLSRAFPIRDEQDQVVRWFGTNTDITEQRVVEHSLRTSEAQLAAMFAQAAVGVVLVDAESGRLLKVNPKFCEIVGYSAGELLGRPCNEITHEGDRQASTDIVNDLVAGVHTSAMLEKRYVRKDGRTVWVRINLARLSPDHDHRIRVMSVIEDVTEHKKIQEELLLAKEAAESANRSKDEFLAVLSHELRSPLNSIHGWTQILRVGQNDAETLREGIEVIERNVRLQNKLIEDLLDVSRIVSGKMQLQKEPFLLAPAVQSAVDSVRPAADKAGIALSVVIESENDEIEGDRTRLQQIVDNLLANAIKFSSSGSEVQVKVARDNGSAKLSVSDNGIGIAPDLLPYIFDRFWQAKGGYKREFGGLGLGLAIVKSLVELHGGGIEAHSAGKGKGATFTVDLPVLRDKVPVRPASRSGSGKQRPADLAGINVLLVDDDPDTLNFLSFAIERQGAKVESYSEAEKGLEALRNGKFDLLISDLGMANFDGIDLIQQLRREENGNGALPAIALSGFVTLEDRDRALSAGFHHHLSKPVDLDNLRRLIRELVAPTEKA